MKNLCLFTPQILHYLLEFITIQGDIGDNSCNGDWMACQYNEGMMENLCIFPVALTLFLISGWFPT